MIATTKWSVGGISTSSQNVKQAYNEELNYSTSYPAKIGLMYVSDYGYAASPENWTIDLSHYDNETNTSNNWMLPTGDDWTISRYSSYSDDAFGVANIGHVYSYSVGYGTDGVRPSFSLSSGVVYAGGTGTASDPLRIKLS